MIAGMCYLFTPMVPLTALKGGPDADPFLQRHARQGLIWSGPFLILLIVTVFAMVRIVQQDILFVCLLPVVLALPFLPGAYFARKVYMGGDVRFPGGSSDGA